MTDSIADTRRSSQCPIGGCTEREVDRDEMRAHLVLEHGMAGEAAGQKATAVFNR